MFHNLSRKYFNFLEDEFNFQISLKRDNFGQYVIYQNRSTLVSVNFCPREGGIVYVLITRLIDGKIPDYPIHVTKETLLNTFDLETLINLRNPDFKIERPSLDKLKDSFSVKIFEKTISQLADGLRRYGQDILKGDFTVFEQLNKIILTKRD